MVLVEVICLDVDNKGSAACRTLDRVPLALKHLSRKVNILSASASESFSSCQQVGKHPEKGKISMATKVVVHKIALTVLIVWHCLLVL